MAPAREAQDGPVAEVDCGARNPRADEIQGGAVKPDWRYVLDGIAIGVVLVVLWVLWVMS